MDPAVLREDMVDGLEHDAKGVVRTEPVGVAMRSVPREPFVPEERAAYEDRAFEHLGTRVLSPSTAARLLEAVAAGPGDDVLVVGAGVGYTAAVLAEIAGEARVHALDIDRRLVLAARENLAEAGYGGVLVDRADGADGLPAYAPYDRILLEAAAVAPPPALVDQLAPGGRLVMPVGTGDQSLVAVAPEQEVVDRAGDGSPGRGRPADDSPGRDHAPDDSPRRRPTGGGPGRVVERFGPVRFEPMLVDGEQAATVERNRTRREERERAERDARRRRGWEQDWIDWEETGPGRRGPGSGPGTRRG